MAPATTCPNDGTQLAEVRDRSPEWAPFVCSSCHRAWWPAELTAEARRAWNPAVQAFEGPPADFVALHALVDRDKARAAARSRSDR